MIKIIRYCLIGLMLIPLTGCVNVSNEIATKENIEQSKPVITGTWNANNDNSVYDASVTTKISQITFNDDGTGYYNMIIKVDDSVKTIMPESISSQYPLTLTLPLKWNENNDNYSIYMATIKSAYDDSLISNEADNTVDTNLKEYLENTAVINDTVPAKGVIGSLGDLKVTLGDNSYSFVRE